MARFVGVGSPTDSCEDPENKNWPCNTSVGENPSGAPKNAPERSNGDSAEGLYGPASNQEIIQLFADRLS